MSNGIGETTPDQNPPQPPGVVLLEAPTEKYTKMANWFLESFYQTKTTLIRDAIKAAVYRHTIGYQGKLWKTSVSELARRMGRNRSNVSVRLGELVSEGVIVRLPVKDEPNKIWLGLADATKTKEAVENLDEGMEGVLPVDNTPLLPVDNTPLLPVDNTPLSIKADADETGAEAKDKSDNKDSNQKQVLVKEPEPAVENSLQEKPLQTAEQTRQQNLSRQLVAGLAKQVESTSSEQLKPVKLLGFPNRSLVPSDQQMDEKTYDALWLQCIGDKPEYNALKTYIWLGFTSLQIEVLLTLLRRSRKNLKGYANTIIRSRYEN